VTGQDHRRLFDPRNRDISPATARRYARYEVLHTVADFTAAALFIVGSILFFFEATTAIGTWAFLVGSVCFALKPTIRLAREAWLTKQHEIERLAGAAPEAPGSFRVRPKHDGD
jgi:hypothetical protein